MSIGNFEEQEASNVVRRRPVLRARALDSEGWLLDGDDGVRINAVGELHARPDDGMMAGSQLMVLRGPFFEKAIEELNRMTMPK